MMDNNDDQNGKKMWEKPWTSDEIRNSAGYWSLAADSGLLLNLKQFSEKIIQKSIELEISLNNLNFIEKQCETKLNNATSEFLMLSNTQFIEVRVYDEDISQLKENAESNKEQVKEKTKEEKDAELLVKINDAVNFGMSIMDKYFVRLENGHDKDELDGDLDENEEDIDTYEVKDPYVLRSLPHLIGSAAYLEDDHVGLVDYEDDEECDVDEGDELKESEESDEKSEITIQSEDEKDDISTRPETNKATIQSNLISNGFNGKESEEEDNGLFGASNFKQKSNLFDDSESDLSEKDDKNEQASNNKIPQSKPMDLASELAAKLAKKAAIKTNSEQSDLPSVSMQQEPPGKTIRAKSLFDGSDESDREDLFEVKKPAVIESKSLFDDEKEKDFEIEDKPIVIEKEEVKKEIEKSKANLPSGAKSLFGDRLESDLKKQLKIRTGLFDDSDNETDERDSVKSMAQKPKIESKVEIKVEKKKISLFDDEDNDEKDNLFSSLKSVAHQSSQLTSKKVASLFDDESEEDKIKPIEAKQVFKNPDKSLFDDEEDDDYFFELNKKLETPSTKPASTTKTSNKSSFLNDEESDLFVSINNNSKLENQQSLQSIKESKVPIVQSNTKSSLFSSDEDDLFGSAKKNVSINKNKQNDNLFAELSKKIQEKPSVVSKSVFSESSEDDLFNSKNKMGVASTLVTDIKQPAIKETKKEEQPKDFETQKAKNLLTLGLPDGDADDDDLFSSNIKVKNIENQPKGDSRAIKLNEKSDLFPVESNEASNNKSAKLSKAGNSFLFDSSDETDLFSTKSAIVEPVKESKNVSFHIPKSKNPLLFDSTEDDDDLFATIPKNISKTAKFETESSSPITFPPSDNESTSNDDVFSTKSNINTPSDTSILNLNINSLELVPDAKPPHNRPSTIEEIVEEKPKENVESRVKSLRTSALINPATLLPGAKLLKQEVKKVKDPNDPFDLDVDRTFNDQSVRSAQKDRIKVAQKKKPPTNRRPNLDESSNLFSTQTTNIEQTIVEENFAQETPKK